MSGAVGIAESDVIDYLRTHPDTLKKVVGAVPARDRCYVSVALAALGLALACGGALGAVSVAVGALGGVLAVGGSSLVAQFCGGRIP